MSGTAGTPGPDRIEERSDLGDDDAALFAFWQGQERIAEKEDKRWQARGRKVVKRYRDERDSASGSDAHRMNILWSNVQTLLPTLYARTPKPDVVRRWQDQDDTGRLAATLLERAIAYSLDQHCFDAVMAAVVEDRLLPGRGTARVMYVPHYGDPLERDNEDDASNDVDNAGDRGTDPLREVVWEEALPSYVFWEDYREGPARTWREVPWVRYRAYMTLDELRTRFGRRIAKDVQLDYTPTGAEDKKPPPDMFKKAIVHETWDRVKKEVVWWAPGTPDLILDLMDDPLGLQGFFPSPDPLLATTTNDKRIPVPDYVQYQDQARELDTLTARIDRLVRALKVSGVYAGSEKHALQQLVDDSTDNKLIPVEDWAHLQDKGGLANVIQWLPIQQVAQTLIQLYDARDRVKQLLYEVTGIGDIMRGATSPNETATAQQLKTNFVTRRIVPQQRQVARFARDMIRLMAGVIAGHFSADTMSQITGYPQLAPVPQLPPPPPQWLPGAPQQMQQPHPMAPPGMAAPPPQGVPQGAGGAPPANDAAPPPGALQQLQEGRVTTFGNGQRWTMQAGAPRRVA